MGNKKDKRQNDHIKLERQKIRDEAIKANERKKLIKNSIIFSLILVSAIFFFKSMGASSDSLFIESENINYGKVSQAEGTKTQEFLIRNDGSKPLTINNMDTSCMCTSVSIIKEGVEGPKFGMAAHGTNPKGWSETFAPGEEGKIKISYDPNAHKDLMGPVTRFINVYTDKGTKRLTLKLVQAK